MVSLWPWKGEDNSPAGFEKTLSTLSTKITEATTRLDAHRQHSRRFKALWTLYTTFAYLLYSIILALVLGWQNWGVIEYAAIAGGPVLIYTVRAGAGKFFDYRISTTQRYLDDLQKQREETIEKLKVATKYNSTQQLLEKYGGESPKPSPRPKGGDEKKKSEKRKQSTSQQSQPVARTGLPPPPTANIQRPIPNQSPQPPSPNPPQYPQPPPNYPPPPENEPGFAPNAFTSASQYVEQSHWYDRLLDVLLGEDETQPKNRMALICTNCRLVNGQAPPGIKTLEELGRWRCGNCGTWNGEESETTKVLADIKNQQSEACEPVSKESDNHSSAGDEDGVLVASSEDDQVESPSEEGSQPEQDEEKEQEAPTRRSTRNKNGKQKG